MPRPRASTGDFPQELRERLLLWCDRHCCLCGQQCGVNIEIHHIDGRANHEENAIPLCFDCHAEIGHYNVRHPRGTRFRPSELRARRDQIYDQYTRHLVPALRYLVHTNQRVLPLVGFSIRHLGGAPSVQVLVTLDSYVNGTLALDQDPYGLYRGQIRWNLNPMEGVDGQFHVPEGAMNVSAHVRVGINITVYDAYDRPHKLLPVTWGLMPDRNSWFLDPIDPEASAAQARQTS
jgi:hypothetical protein